MSQLKKSYIEINQTLEAVVLNTYFFVFTKRVVLVSIVNETEPIDH